MEDSLDDELRPVRSATSESVYNGSFIQVRVETLVRPIGGTSRFEIVDHPDAAAIVAIQLDAAGQPSVLLVRQLRPAIGRETWELPAGLVRPDERDDPQRTAERELREETGYAARSWRRLTREYPSPGFSTEAITLYLATDVYPMGEKLDGEVDALAWVRLTEALARCRSGEIDDGKTLLGLALAAATMSAPAAGTGSARGGETMPRDTVNLPLGRPPTLDASIQPGGKLDDTLKLDGLLLEEFNYAGNSAYQAMEDRARMFNLYLVLVGVLVSVLVGVYQLSSSSLKTFTQPLTIVLLALAAILGLVFFVKLIRLRQAHQDSILTMSVIKEYYIARFQANNPNIGEVLRWRMKDIKAGERLGSVTFLVCFAVAFLDSLALATAAALAYLVVARPATGDEFTPGALVPAVGIAAAVLVVVLLGQVWYYRVALSHRKERARIEAAQRQVERALAGSGA